MSDDKQTKTQPIYFKPWAEVEEGEEVIAFRRYADNKPVPVSESYKKIRGKLVFRDLNDKTWKATLTNPNSLSFLSVPQDRPKPNIWDEYMDGEYFEKPYDMPASRYLSKDDILERKDYFKAKVAWINHVLDEKKLNEKDKI